MKKTINKNTGSFISVSDRHLREFYLEGVAAGREDCILEILSDYGRVPTGLREKIKHQKDLRELKRLFRLALDSRSMDEFIFRM